MTGQMGWRILACCSRVGAEHLRRGIPGQDSVLQWAGCSRDGEPVQVLALADGHGHRRHWLSGLGSAEACRVAVLTLSRWLAGLELRAAEPALLDGLRRQLAMDQSRRIHSRWLAAVRHHWRQQQSIRGEEMLAVQMSGFSPEPYGCTLAVLLLTPRWWAVSGLGDWDLVGLDRHRKIALLSEEISSGSDLETTSSLCQLDAAAVMAARTQLNPMPLGEAIALLLSSDGVRKSCGASSYYLGWSAAVLREMGDEAGLQRLERQLDRLSAHGTGDDVSVLSASNGQWASPLAFATEVHCLPDQRLPDGRRSRIRMKPSRGSWPGQLSNWLLGHHRLALASISLLSVFVLILALVVLFTFVSG